MSFLVNPKRYKVLYVTRYSVSPLNSIDQSFKDFAEYYNFYFDIINYSSLLTFDMSCVGVIVVGSSEPPVSGDFPFYYMSSFGIPIISLCSGLTRYQIIPSSLSAYGSPTSLTMTQQGADFFGVSPQTFVASNITSQDFIIQNAPSSLPVEILAKSNMGDSILYREEQGVPRVHFQYWDTRKLTNEGRRILALLIGKFVGRPQFPHMSSWVSPAIDVSYVKQVIDSKVGWEEHSDFGTEVKVYCGLSDSYDIIPKEFTRVQNLGKLECLTIGMSLENNYLFFKLELTSSADLCDTPEVFNIKAMIENFRTNSVLTIKVKDFMRLTKTTDRLELLYNSSEGTLRGTGGNVKSFVKDVSIQDIEHFINPNQQSFASVSVTQFSCLVTKLLYRYFGLEQNREFIKCLATEMVLKSIHISQVEV